MIPFFDSLRDINVLSVSVRMLLAGDDDGAGADEANAGHHLGA